MEQVEKKDLYSLVDIWPQDNYYEDVAIISQIAIHCKSVGVIKEALYYYRYRLDSICSSSKLITKVRQMANNVIIPQLHIKAHGEYKKYRKELLHRKCIVKSVALERPWRYYIKVFPEVTLYLASDPFFSIGNRVGLIAKYFGMYRLYKKYCQ